MVAPVPALSIVGALCLPDRHRRDKPDKPGNDVSAVATSFAPLTFFRLCERYARCDYRPSWPS